MELSNKYNSIIGSHRNFNLFYLTIVIFDLVAMYTMPSLTMIIKPLIVTSLLGLYVWVAKPQENGVLLALIFALFGDCFLMFNGDLFFQLGLGCFLIMQILYLFQFKKYISTPTLKKKSYIALVLFTALLFLFISYPHLGNFLWPVVIYALAISAMVTFAILRSSNYASSPIALGAFFFMISDLSLAYSKFIAVVPGSPVLIIATYSLAQFLIVNGLIYDIPGQVKEAK